MEWVETTGRTIDEATARAIDLLGIDDADAEVVILAEPRSGLFGRLKGEARVRARVRPARLRPKLDRRDRRRRSAREERPSASAPAGATPAVDGEPTKQRTRSRSKRGKQPTSADVPADVAADATPTPIVVDTGALEPATTNGEAAADSPAAAPVLSPTRGEQRRPGRSGRSHSSDHQNSWDDEDDEQGDDMERDGTIDKDRAADFLLGLAECLGAGATAKVIETPEAIEVELDGDDLGLLIGPRGQTLQAVQELTRAVAQRGLPQQRLRVDVSGYRKRRAEALGRFAVQIAEEVAASGVAKALEPMPSPDRKVVHDAVAAVAGVVSSSDGEDPNRRVVISPA